MSEGQNPFSREEQQDSNQLRCQAVLNSQQLDCQLCFLTILSLASPHRPALVGSPLAQPPSPLSGVGRQKLLTHMSQHHRLMQKQRGLQVTLTNYLSIIQKRRLIQLRFPKVHAIRHSIPSPPAHTLHSPPAVTRSPPCLLFYTILISPNRPSKKMVQAMHSHSNQSLIQPY